MMQNLYLLFHTPKCALKRCTGLFMTVCWNILTGRRESGEMGILNGLWDVWKCGSGNFWKSPGLLGQGWGKGRELQAAHFSPGRISCFSLFWTRVRCAGLGMGMLDPFATWLSIFGAFASPLGRFWALSQLDLLCQQGGGEEGGPSKAWDEHPILTLWI